MTKQVSYEIAIKGVALEVIGHKIDKVGLKVLPYSKQELGNDAYDPNSIICIGYFPDSVAPELIASNMNSLRLLEGVKDVKILSVSESREKRSKMHHFMIPLLISTAVNSLSVFAIILDENMKLDWRINLDLIIFGAVSFWSAVGYHLYYRNKQ